VSSNRCSSLISRVNNSAKCNRTPRTARYCFHGGGCTKLWYKDKNSAALSPALPSSPKKPVRRSSTYKDYVRYLQTAGQNHNIKVANSAIKNVEVLKYLEMAVIQNYLNTVIKCRLSTSNTLFHSGILYSHLPSQDSKIKIHKATFSPVISHGCGTWSPTVWE